MRSGFSLAELVVTLSVVSVAGGAVAVSLSARGQSLEGDAKARKHAQLKSEATVMRNIVLGLALYADTNKFYYPGITAAGKYRKDDFKGRKYAAAANAASDEEQKTGAGCTVGVDQALAAALMLEDGGVSAAQWFSPGEGDVAVKKIEAKAGEAAKVEACHSSYAMLAYGRPSLKTEWKATTSQQAVVLASRLVFGEKEGQYQSLWSAEGGGQWKGAMVRNDGSVDVQTAVGGDDLGHLKYGAKVFKATGNTASVAGIFGKHTDMAHFDAEEKKAQLGSAMDGAKAEKKEEKK